METPRLPRRFLPTSYHLPFPETVEGWEGLRRKIIQGVGRGMQEDIDGRERKTHRKIEWALREGE